VNDAMTPQQAAERILFELKKVVVGQQRVLERLVTCLIADGHCLLEGVPGVAKTLMCSTLARSIGGSFHRIQFTFCLPTWSVPGSFARRVNHSTSN
jgi:MoxR-like ATPase